MNMTKQDLVLLMFFDALATHRSVSKAAQHMRVTQPAVSNALAKLRNKLGDPLFVKTKGGVAPTPKALELIPTIRSSLSGLQDILSTGDTFDPATMAARITLTATDYANFVLMPRLARHLQEHAPLLDVDILPPNRDRANEWLEQGEIDFRIGWVRRPLPALHAKVLFRDNFVCLVRKGHPFIRESLSAEEYCSASHVRTASHRFSELTESAPMIDDAVAALGKKLRISVRAPDHLSVPFIVANSDLIATVPQQLANAFLGVLPLRLLPPPLPLQEVSISLLWHQRTQRSGLHRWFRETLVRFSESL